MKQEIPDSDSQLDSLDRQREEELDPDEEADDPCLDNGYGDY